ncbi:DNA-binding transcriptional regulator, AcrR family [Amycolatopsis arida]|uniref:DNA-binding transcriptional regulator, AcrR family n=1 Tax=Amycolatopsis arida TaxID=587909 RepID=A0A1I5SNV9_9PSEU|nr:TetR/AcrR family transcriptional regulator [Amycolatopsis arida]TDX96409.1 AcrR family transcriptional regulator [Amycolatopsis arida]SFP72378.1 DNA-binding transcriptional regulator, AcrR family [Amycolatopsis arida]
MASRREWLDEGLAILAELGAPSITIERLCQRLGVTKGSFYHHFRGMRGYRTALLEHFETAFTTRLIDEVEGGPAATPMAKLEHLADLVASAEHETGPELEVGMRAWALQDDEARRIQQRVDRTRFDYLRSLTTGLDIDAETAADLADLLYLTVIGAGHLVPPVKPDDLHRLFRQLLRLGTHSKGEAPDDRT